MRIELIVPRGEIIVKYESSMHSAIQQAEKKKTKKDQETATPHKDMYVAIRDAFKAARHQLQDYARKQRSSITKRRRTAASAKKLMAISKRPRAPKSTSTKTAC